MLVGSLNFRKRRKVVGIRVGTGVDVCVCVGILRRRILAGSFTVSG